MHKLASHFSFVTENVLTFLFIFYLYCGHWGELTFYSHPYQTIPCEQVFLFLILYFYSEVKGLLAHLLHFSFLIEYKGWFVSCFCVA
jgi:hypothetical protein